MADFIVPDTAIKAAAAAKTNPALEATRVDRGPPAASFTLFDGTKVDMWEPTGDDLARSMQATPDNASGVLRTYALIAQCTTFNSERLRFEDVKALKLRRLNPLMKHFGLLTGAVDEENPQ